MCPHIQSTTFPVVFSFTNAVQKNVFCVKYCHPQEMMC